MGTWPWGFGTFGPHRFAQWPLKPLRPSEELFRSRMHSALKAFTWQCQENKCQKGANQLGRFTGYTRERCESECKQKPSCLSLDWGTYSNICYLSTTRANGDGGGPLTVSNLYDYCEKVPVPRRTYFAMVAHTPWL